MATRKSWARSWGEEKRRTNLDLAPQEPGPNLFYCELSLAHLGSGDQRANDSDHSNDKEKRGVLIVRTGGKATEGQNMVDPRNKVIHTEQSSYNSHRDCAKEKSWALHG